MKYNPCGKQLYPTPSTAEMGIDAIARTHKRKYLSYYWCHKCRGFHHTSRYMSTDEIDIQIEHYKNHIKTHKDMSDDSEYTDKTVLSFGKHKGKALIEVPASYLIWLYNEGISDQKLKTYIEENMQALRKEVQDAADTHFKSNKS